MRPSLYEMTLSVPAECSDHTCKEFCVPLSDIADGVITLSLTDLLVVVVE